MMASFISVFVFLVATTSLVLASVNPSIKSQPSPFEDDGTLRLGGFCKTEGQVDEHNALADTGEVSYRLQFRDCHGDAACLEDTDGAFRCQRLNKTRSVTNENGSIHSTKSTKDSKTPRRRVLFRRSAKGEKGTKKRVLFRRSPHHQPGHKSDLPVPQAFEYNTLERR